MGGIGRTVYKASHLVGFYTERWEEPAVNGGYQLQPARMLQRSNHYKVVINVELREREDGRIYLSVTHDTARQIPGRGDTNRWEWESCGAGAKEAMARVDRPANGWTPELIAEVGELADYWHLNDMRAGCEHQRARGWGKLHCQGYHRSEAETCRGSLGPNGQAVELEKLGLPNNRRPKQRGTDYNTKPWTQLYQCVFDAVSVPCPECGYQYGHQWLYEPLPGHVAAKLMFLPGLRAKAS